MESSWERAGEEREREREFSDQRISGNHHRHGTEESLQVVEKLSAAGTGGVCGDEGKHGKDQD